MGIPTLLIRFALTLVAFTWIAMSICRNVFGVSKGGGLATSGYAALLLAAIWSWHAYTSRLPAGSLDRAEYERIALVGFVAIGAITHWAFGLFATLPILETDGIIVRGIMVAVYCFGVFQAIVIGMTIGNTSEQPGA